MRVITGSARGKRLITLPGNDVVRPTPERVKEAIFSAIQFDIEGRNILDLFAGSGQLGIEALSRGAAKVTFVDISDASVNVIKKNLSGTDFENRAAVIKSDSLFFISGCRETFDIAFLDPPYHSGLIEKALPDVCAHMSNHGRIICEHPSDVTLPNSVCGFSVEKSYRYGKIIVSVYTKGDFRE